MKYLIPALILAVFYIGYHLQKAPEETMSCIITAEVGGNCSPVLSLMSGNLNLQRSVQKFELTADYEACFQAEKIKFTGQYEQRGQTNIQDIELLAQTMVVDEGEVQKFPKTIGLISLDKKSGKGHFVDIWATTQAYGKNKELPANAEVTCQMEQQPN